MVSEADGEVMLAAVVVRINMVQLLFLATGASYKAFAVNQLIIALRK